MKFAFLLLAATAFGQLIPYKDADGWFVRQVPCDCCKPSGHDGLGVVTCCALLCVERVPLPAERNYRIEWVRPALVLRPTEKSYNAGQPSKPIGWEEFGNVFVFAPKLNLVIVLTSGETVTITRAEIEARANAPK